ncbi:MAG: endo-beta-N-acetylglucosaminidase [Prevotella fusca]|uniref:endo-beta-N-acetylglucosaminidase n=1 Tax=Prevotella fusca TaxID=589436 RepID=UPI003FA0BB75
MKKKSTLAAMLMAALLSGSPLAANAQTYDFSKVDWTRMVEVFADALSNGKQFPTDQEIMKLGISRADLEFMRSHVKQRQRVDNTNRLVPDTYAGRKLWMNTPMGSGSGGDAGYPTGSFHSDVFSLWNYTAMWGSWNHSIGQVPGSWTDAAHKNGCDMLGGTVFFDASHGDLGAYRVWKKYTNTHDATGYNGYKYVKPLVNMLRYFGVDGININWEAGSPTESMGFHKACYAYAKETGFKNFHIGLYTTSSTLSSGNVAAHYADRDEQAADAMLNYGGESYIEQSEQVAKEHNPKLGASGVWQGFWIVRMDYEWSSLDYGKEVNLCLWGEHKDSRFWSYNSGAGTMEQQANYQSFLERAFSGGNRNPLNRPAVSDDGNKMEWSGSTPPLSTFAGFSTWIPERSTVQGKFPFATNFSLGNGDRYNYRGKMASGAWYNMSAQDVVPTYRWLVVNAGQDTYSNALTVNFSHKDSYNGGSCLQLQGDASKATDVILYKTDITPNDAANYALVSIKGAGERAEGMVESNLYLILKVNGTWKEYKVPDNTGKSWQEHRIALNLNATDKITNIGFRVKGGANKYNMYVGSLELNDGNKVTPTAIKDLKVKKTGETPSTMDVKLDWSVNANANEYGLVYNDDANIDHFEILFKDGANGKVSEVGRTSQWATFIPALNVKTATEPYIGVVAVSKDLKSYSEILWQRLEKDATVEEDPFGTYGQSSLDVNAQGYQTALKLRGVQHFKTTGAEGDINFQQTYDEFKAANKDGKAKYLNYRHVDNLTLKVKQGQTIEFRLKGFNGEELGLGKDDCRYCFVGGWMDFDGSGTFNYGKGMEEQPFWLPLYDNTTQDDAEYKFDETTKDGTEAYGERVFRHGSLRKGNLTFVKGEGLKGKIKIPADAHVGKSRLRIVYSDAWFPGQFTPTANNNKGYTLDIDVEISGDESIQRGEKDLHDKGELEDWNVVTEITEVATDNSGSVQVVNGNLVFKGVKSATIYTVDGMLVKTLTKPTVVRGNELGRGVFLVKTGANKTTKVIL